MGTEFIVYDQGENPKNTKNPNEIRKELASVYYQLLCKIVNIFYIITVKIIVILNIIIFISLFIIIFILNQIFYQLMKEILQKLGKLKEAIAHPY